MPKFTLTRHCYQAYVEQTIEIDAETSDEAIAFLRDPNDKELPFKIVDTCVESTNEPWEYIVDGVEMED